MHSKPEGDSSQGLFQHRKSFRGPPFVPRKRETHFVLIKSLPSARSLGRAEGIRHTTELHCPYPSHFSQGFLLLSDRRLT